MNKSEVRAAIRGKKRAMTEEEILRQSQILGEKLAEHPLYRAAKTVYFYLPYNQEVRTWPMIRRAWDEGKLVAAPRVFGQEMRFIPIFSPDDAAPGYCGIPEPLADGVADPDPDALVLLPGLAFDPEGRRIGYGGGFYDRFLAQHPTHPTLALCYDFQLLERLEVEAHDIRADAVICAGED